jgi:transposase-like protein
MEQDSLELLHPQRYIHVMLPSRRSFARAMAERGVTVSHPTILRWAQRYVPEFEKRWGRYARRVHSSWRMDETAVSVRGGAHYL